MEVNLKEFLKGRLLGNVRTGIRGENDRPIKLAYFNVHIDKSTPSLAVELFNEAYNNPNKIKIKFVCQNPMISYYERYEGKRRKCYGNGKKARRIDDAGKPEIIECNEKECSYRKNGKCKKAARLYFYMDKISPDEGVWCYPIGSEKGINYIEQRIERANRLGKDLTNEWYELYLIEEDSPAKGKNYIPDIRQIKNIEEKDTSCNQDKNPNQIKNNAKNLNKTDNGNNKNNTNSNNAKKYLMLKGFAMTIFENQKVPKIKFMNTEKKDVEVVLLPNGNQEILKLKPGSIILPLKIVKTDTNILLNDYKILKAISNEIENKKAV